MDWWFLAFEGVNVNHGGTKTYTALAAAVTDTCRVFDRETMQLLMDHGANVNAVENGVLHNERLCGTDRTLFGYSLPSTQVI